MKRNFTLFSLFLVFCAAKFNAQNYTGIPLTGFNQDVVAESNPATGSTGTTIDAAGYVLYSALYTNTTTLGGLNATGVYTTTTRSYTLASYAQKNTLRVLSNATDSLSLTTPASYSGLSILGFSSDNDALTDVTLRFADGTSATYSSRTLYNWSSTQPAIIQGFGKTNRASNSIYFTATEPKMYSIDIPVICANQSKLITRIVVKNKTIGATVYLFAAAGIGKSNFVANSIPATCKGTATGTAKALGVDAYGPLSYTWMPGGQTTQTATNLTAGMYTVTIVDGNGCSYTRTVNVTEPATAFSITAISATSLSCGSASTATAQVSVTGGNTPYVYTWINTAPVSSTLTTNSLTGLSAGNYSVSVKDNNGCTLTATTNVATPNVVISVNTSSLLCGSTANGSATVTSITGATGPFTYSWTPSAQTSSVATGLSAQTYTVRVTDNASCTISQTLSINAPSISLTSSATTCTLSTGSATVNSVTGGAGAPYTYSWTPSAQTGSVATNLAAGVYTVIVKDNANCPVTKTLTIGSDQPSLTVSTSSLLCGTLANGSATVTSITGGIGPFTYSWMPSAQTGSVASNLGSGVYSVTVKGTSGCTVTQTLVITKPSVTIATSPTGCKGTQPTGSATVVAVNGGVAPYAYSWDSGTMSNIASGTTVSNIDEGAYVVNVTDANNCVFSQSFNVLSTAPSALLATATATNATCSGINNGQARVTPTGGVTPYSYSWNTNPPQYTATATGLASPKDYVVSVIDFNGCLISKVVTIYPAPIGLTVYASPSTTICPGTSVNLSITGLSGTGTYTWSTGANTTSITATPTASLTVYSVTATATSSCIAQGTVAVVTSTNAAENCPTSLKEEAFVSYNLYPNPTAGVFTIAFSHVQNNATVEVMDALGKLVVSQPVNGMETTVNTETLQNGIYFVTVRDEKAILVRTKVIKQ